MGRDKAPAGQRFLAAVVGRFGLLFALCMLPVAELPAEESGCLPGDTLGPALTDSLATRDEHPGKKENIFVRFFRNFNDYDSTYIEPQYYNYAFMVQNTTSFQSYRLLARDQAGNRQSISMRPAPTLKVGPYFGWRWIFLGYTLDVAHLSSPGSKSEFNLSLYSAMLGLDFVYMKNKGDFRLLNTEGFEGVGDKDFRGTHFDGMETLTASISGYYVFNHRRFSYPAAFSQSTVQRKSCGSWILGLRYDHQRLNFDHTQLPPALTGQPGNEKIMDEMKWQKIDYYAYSVSGGYAYNWVFARNWLLGVSVMPAIGYKRTKGERLRGDELFVSIKNLNFDCISRLGLVWNNTRWFAGLSLVSHLYTYTEKRLTLTNGVNFLNLYVGLNFNKKKQYRH